MAYSSKIPYHVTGLLIFVCVCQVYLLCQINSFSFVQLPIDDKVKTNKHFLTSSSKLQLNHRAMNRDLLAAYDDNVNAGNILTTNVTSLFQNPSPASVFPRSNQITNSDEIRHNYGNANFRIHKDMYVSVLKDPSFMCDISDDDLGNITLIVLVHSSVENMERRDAIRNTWGQISRDFDRDEQVKVIFVIGLPEKESVEESEYNEFVSEGVNPIDHVYKESKLYRDILLGDFVDTYHNLTLKSLFGLHWALRNCFSSKFILKTDDDVYMNLPLILQVFNGHQNCDIIGSLNTQSKVERNGLWGVRPDIYPQNLYPSYVSGCAYVISSKSLHKLLQKLVFSFSVIHLEDVYITGILAPSVNNSVCHHQMFPYWIQGPTKQNIDGLKREKLFGLHNVQYEEMYDIHQIVLKRHDKDTTVDIDKLKSMINALRTDT